MKSPHYNLSYKRFARQSTVWLRLSLLCVVGLNVATLAAAKQTITLDKPIIGADISFVPQEEARGKKYADKGVEADVLSILKANSFNWIRLRLFVDPTAENGYSKEGFCGLEKTLEMAKRIKQAGLHFLLDFHYSDTWADPGKQFTPSSWQRYTGSGLEVQVYRYTQEVLNRFIEEGVRPDMVQVGNEINNGMLWPQGKLPDGDLKTDTTLDMEPFCVLLRCASAAVRAVDPTIAIMVHIACGGQHANQWHFLTRLSAATSNLTSSVNRITPNTTVRSRN